MPVKTLLPVLLVALAAGCGDAPPQTDPADQTGDATPAADTRRPDTAPQRPASRTETIRLEGMPEPIRLSLFRAPEDFPLPFSTYVPGDMAAEPSVAGGESDEAGGAGGAAVRFLAEFGGRRNADAFVHLFVFPPGTDRNTALGQMHGYHASRGIPVSQGLEPLQDDEATRRMPWAIESYAFRYQSRGEWLMGTIGVGEQDGRFYQLVRHYPAEYGDGFSVRADLITQTWLWGDGSPLVPAPRDTSAR